MSRTDPLETRALMALWRNHPDTPPADRWGWRAKGRARQNRTMLLGWAATKSDEDLLWCRNLGVTSLAWIRANQTPVDGLADLTRLIDDALEEWSTRADPEPSDQVAVFLARRILFDRLSKGTDGTDGGTD